MSADRLRRRRGARSPKRTSSFAGAWRSGDTPASRWRRAAWSPSTTARRAASRSGARRRSSTSTGARSRRCSISIRRRVRLVEVDVGGGFGVRGELYPEDFLVPFLALHARSAREVDRGSRRAPRRDEPRSRAGARDRASRRARTERSSRSRTDRGATRAHTCGRRACCPRCLPGAHLPGPYVLGGVFECTSHAVLTNRTPVGTYRGPGMTEAAFVRERMLDLVPPSSA